MSLIEKLKSMFDTRTEAEKAYQNDPLRRRTQYMKVYVKGLDKPLIRVYSREDFTVGHYMFRNADVNSFNPDLNRWLAERGSNGIRIDNIWYAPESIDRIELGEQTVEEL